jgi:ribonuclease BN (tRNA processing enzyme)
MVKYHIISSGSHGNAVIIEKSILIDVGVSCKALKEHISELKIVLLTHIHGDHFNATTVRRLAYECPTLHFACGEWLAAPLLEAGVQAEKIDILKPKTRHNYGIFDVEPVPLFHNVPNFGYKLTLKNSRKVFYATDTGTLDGISAENYDLYMVEANYEDDEIQQRIAEKHANGEYSYEFSAMQNHLSKAKADAFLYKNMGEKSEYVYLHEHRE